MKNLRRIVSFALVLLTLTAGAALTETSVKIVVGATPVPHAEILAAAVPLLAEQGIELVVQEFTDYVLPNLALDAGDIDANFFQHLPYLTDFNTENGTKLIPLAPVHFEPFGIYPSKTKSLDELKDGAKVAVPNDTTNEARALLLLEASGLITLPEGAGLTVTVKDIIENPKKLEIVELEAAQIPLALPDFDIAAINGNYALQAGLDASTDALAVEAADSVAADTFANYLVIKEGSETNEALVKLAEVLSSQAIVDFIKATYGDAVIPKPAATDAQ